MKGPRGDHFQRRGRADVIEPTAALPPLGVLTVLCRALQASVAAALRMTISERRFL